MGRQRYTRPDGAVGTHCGTLAVTVWSNGEVTASLAAWEPGGARLRHRSLPVLRPEGLLVPLVLEGLALAAEAAIDEWATGQLG